MGNRTNYGTGRMTVDNRQKNERSRSGNPYDNSIKTQGDEKELTLFTCSQKGTMRFVVRCIYKEAVMDE